MKRLIAVLALAAPLAAAALALPSGALAFPTTPQIHPLPPTVLVTPGVANHVGWEPSTVDTINGYPLYSSYQLQVVRYPIGSTPTSTYPTTPFSGCCSYALNLTPGFHYVVKVRAYEWWICAFNLVCHDSWSGWSTPVAFDAVGPAVADF
jgi:hypothetical protein